MTNQLWCRETGEKFNCGRQIIDFFEDLSLDGNGRGFSRFYVTAEQAPMTRIGNVCHVVPELKKK